MTSTRRYFVGTDDLAVWPIRPEEEHSSSISEMRYSVRHKYLDVIFREHSGKHSGGCAIVFYRYQHVPMEVWLELIAPRQPGTPGLGAIFYKLIKTQASKYPYTRESLEPNLRKPRFDFTKD